MLLRINPEAVIAARKKKDISTAELARRSKIPQPNLSRVERGEEQVSWSRLEVLAKELDTTPLALVGPDMPLTQLRALGAENWPFSRGRRRKEAVA